MGFNQSLMSGANIIAPLLSGALIGHRLYAAWALTMAAIAACGAITAAGSVASNESRYLDHQRGKYQGQTDGLSPQLLAKDARHSGRHRLVEPFHVRTWEESVRREQLNLPLHRPSSLAHEQERLAHHSGHCPSADRHRRVDRHASILKCCACWNREPFSNSRQTQKACSTHYGQIT
jgi:hypothetical protein